MSDNLPTIIPTKRERSKSGPVTGRLRKALMALIWENKTDNEAAVTFKINVTTIRSALQRPHVRQFVREQRQVLLARESAKNPHALMKVRDASANGVAVVSATKALEELANNELRVGMNAPRQPGVIIQIINAPAETPPARLTPKVTIDHRPVLNDMGSDVGTVDDVVSTPKES